MKKLICSAVSLCLLLNYGSLQAQVSKEKEIIILKKGDKDSKTTIEIKDGQVYVNGKKADNLNIDTDSIQVKVNLAPGTRLVPGFKLEELDLVAPNEVIQNGGSKAFLGVSTESSPESGAKVVSVSENSAAQKAGLQNGDVIVAVDDQPISSPADLAEVIGKYKPATEVSIKILRDDKKQTLKATLGEARNTTIIRRNFRSLPGNGREMLRDQDFERIIEEGLDSSFRNFKFPEGNTFNFDFSPKPKLGLKVQDLEEGKGAKILEITKDSPAEKAGLKTGDIITEFDGKKIEEADDMVASVKSASDKSSMNISIKRDGKSQSLTIKIPKKLKTANL
jgi:serine protease Do